MTATASTNIDLLPGNFWKKTGLLNRVLYWSLTWGRAIIVCAMIIVLLAFFYRFSLDQQNADLNEVISQKQLVIVSYQDFEKESRALLAKLENIKKLSSGQAPYVEAMLEIENTLPQEIVVRSLVFSGRQMKISAETGDSRTIYFFHRLLTNSPRFQKISLERIARKDKSTPAVEFEITALLSSGKET